MSKPSTIAIDGPAASGKSTAAALLARSLGYFYFDTGVMYRAVTWAALDQKIEINRVDQVSDLAERLTIEVQAEGPQDGRPYTVLVDGQDVTWQLRSPEVDRYVSRVSAYARVRAALTVQQRRLAAAGSIIMVGRDIGTVVLPEADLKIFMQASAEERARRRYAEALAQGKAANFDEILEAIVERDEQDRAKPISPMIPAPDAVIVETDQMSIAEVLARLEQLVANSNEQV